MLRCYLFLHARARSQHIFTGFLFLLLHIFSLYLSISSSHSLQANVTPSCSRAQSVLGVFFFMLFTAFNVPQRSKTLREKQKKKKFPRKGKTLCGRIKTFHTRVCQNWVIRGSWQTGNDEPLLLMLIAVMHFAASRHRQWLSTRLLGHLSFSHTNDDGGPKLMMRTQKKPYIAWPAGGLA